MDPTDKKPERVPSAYDAIDKATLCVMEDMEAQHKATIEYMDSRIKVFEQNQKGQDKLLATFSNHSAAIGLQLEELRKEQERVAVLVKSFARDIDALEARMSKLGLGIGKATKQGVKPKPEKQPAVPMDPFLFDFNMPRDNDQPGFNVPSDLEDPLHSMATPPAIPPIVNGNAVHFQPQVPTTQFGPITQSYIPRYDLPVMGYSVYPPGGYPQVTGQGIPLYQMNSYALHGGYMMGPQGPMVPAPGYMPGAPMAHMPMPSAGMHSILMPGASMHPMPMPGAGMSGVPMPGNPTPGGQARVHFEPSLGIGLTQSERLAADIEHAMKESCFEPQDFMPVNKDPYKEWWVMEMDGNWGLYQRRQIDKLKHKWCVRDGWFYAKRLEAPPDV